MSSPPRAQVRAAKTERLGWRAALTLAIIVSCQLMPVVDSSIVNIALPSIQRGLHFSPTGPAWVPSLYTLVFGGLLLAGGRAGDIWGRRRMLLTGIAVFTAASLLGGFAASAAWLLAARAVQGLGRALAGPSTLSLIAASFPEGQERNRALGAFSMVAGLGVALGYLLGGVITAEPGGATAGRPARSSPQPPRPRASWPGRPAPPIRSCRCGCSPTATGRPAWPACSCWPSP